jgi:hypothetical protein
VSTPKGVDVRTHRLWLSLVILAAPLALPAAASAGTVSLGTAPGTAGGPNEIRFSGGPENSAVLIEYDERNAAVVLSDPAAPLTLDAGAAQLCVITNPTEVTCDDPGGGTLNYWSAELGAGDDSLTVAAEAFVAGRASGGDGNDTILGADSNPSWPGNDTLDGGPGDDILAGRGGDDQLTGGPGTDAMDGFTGNDRIDALDGVGENVACGAGADTVVADPVDDVRDCEQPDADQDGSLAHRDCDDANPARAPGKREVVGNAVDEDCNGVAAMPDFDRDGSPSNLDCNDRSRNVAPGKPEIVDNKVDEDCSGAPAYSRPLSARLSYRVRVRGRITRIQRMSVVGLPAASEVQFRCPRGCLMSRRPHANAGNGGSWSFAHLFIRGRARAGNVVELWLSRTGETTRVLRLRFRNGRRPQLTRLCAPAGATRAQRC